MFKRLFGKSSRRRSRGRSRTHMEKRTAESGRAAMDWLLRGEEPSSSKGGKLKLEREIAEVLTKPKQATRKGSPRKPSGPKSSPRAPRARPARGSMSFADFYLSLPPNLKRHGENTASVKDVVKQIRTDLAAAIKAGVLPDGTQFSITNPHYSSVNVSITRWPAQVFTDKYLEHLMDPSTTWNERYGEQPHDARLTPELNAAIKAITKIGERHNYREMGPYDDYARVGYYLTVSASPVIAAAELGAKTESDKELRAKLEEGAKAAKAVGPAATKAICGSADLRRADSDCLDQLIRLAKEADGKPVEYDGRRRGWYPIDPAKSHLGKLKLGKTTYEIVTKKDNDISLLGPRGGWSSLVQNAKHLDQWAHIGFGGGNQTVWYQRHPDGTFTRI